MTRVLHSQSTLTNRYQTTIPESIRKILHLNKCDKIYYEVERNGKVTISRIDDNDDPVITSFLSFMASDIKQHRKNIKSFDPELITRAKLLVENIKIDLNAPLSEEDE